MKIAITGGKGGVDLKEKLKQLREGGRAAGASARNAVIKFLTNAASLVRSLSVQNVKLT